MVKLNKLFRHILSALRLGVAVVGMAGMTPASLGQTVPTAFTYQGELQSAGTPYAGSADFQFRLYTTANGPVQVGPVLSAGDIACVAGRFTVQLDFVQTVPVGSYLEISVRAPHDASNTVAFTVLAPRQAVTAAPLARAAGLAEIATTATTAQNSLSFGGQSSSFYQNAGNLTTGTIPSARIGGSYSNALTLTNAANAFTGSGAGLSALNAGNFSTGTLSALRGGTGTSIAAATIGQVLKWNGTAFTPQDDLDTNTTYTAGAGINLAGTVFSIPAGGVNSAMILDSSVGALDIGGAQVNNTHLASDAAGLLRVSGGAMRSDGTNIGIGLVAPTATFHLQTVAPVLSIQSTLNGGSAQLNMTETVTGNGLGGRILYDGNTNLFTFGTVNSTMSPMTSAMSILRGSPDVTFAGNIIIPTTTRSVMYPPSAFIPSSGTTGYSVDMTALFNTSGVGVTAQFYAPIMLPDGATITGISVRCLVNDPGVTMTVEIDTVPIADIAFTGSVYHSSGASALLQTFSSSSVNIPINNTLNTYCLRAYWPGPLPTSSVVKLVAVRLDYTIMSLLP